MMSFESGNAFSRLPFPWSIAKQTGNNTYSTTLPWETFYRIEVTGCRIFQMILPALRGYV
jgi:hypothetical protein